MVSVTVSPKYQVAIPLKFRKLLGVKPGQMMRVIAYEDQLVMILLRPIKEARGSLKGIDTSIPREDEHFMD
jgi:AbrB family looped-hinge helix DNA binding protein